MLDLPKYLLSLILADVFFFKRNFAFYLLYISAVLVSDYQVEKAHNADLHCVDWNPHDDNLILTGYMLMAYFSQFCCFSNPFFLFFFVVL